MAKSGHGKVTAKDKAKHRDGTMTAAEFKRQFCNKAARTMSDKQVSIRNAVGVKGSGATAKDKRRLREDWRNRNPIPGKMYKPENSLSLPCVCTRPEQTL